MKVAHNKELCRAYPNPKGNFTCIFGIPNSMHISMQFFMYLREIEINKFFSDFNTFIRDDLCELTGLDYYMIYDYITAHI